MKVVRLSQRIALLWLTAVLWCLSSSDLYAQFEPATVRGTIRSTLPARQLQFALKLYF